MNYYIVYFEIYFRETLETTGRGNSQFSVENPRDLNVEVLKDEIGNFMKIDRNDYNVVIVNIIKL